MTDNDIEEPPEVDDRALMTTIDRKKIAEIDYGNAQRYMTVSRVRRRLESLEEDLDWLEKHHPELYNEIKETVAEH